MPPLDTHYSDDSFHRNYELSSGFLSPDAFPPINWTLQSDIERLFPFYKREQIRVDAQGVQRAKVIDIPKFDLKSPDNSQTLFDNTKLFIEGSKRCALFGINGSGKTTLFEAISAGAIEGLPTYLHIHHMKELEHNEDADKVSVIDTVLCSHPFRRVLLAIIEKLKALIENENPTTEQLQALQSNLAYCEKLLENCQGTPKAALETAQKMLRVLGFDEIGERAPLSSLSGGLRMRVALASSFFIQSDLLLLDEPTNHLDLPSVLWLENKLRGYSGSFLLVTHDRTLLENVVTSVMLIQDQKLEYFPCDFKEFEKRREENDQARERMVDQFLQRNKGLNPMSPLVKQHRQYTAWKDARYARKLLMQSKFTFANAKKLDSGDLPPSEVSLIRVENVRFSYDEKKGLPFIFDTPISYNVKVGTRVGIMGPNGAGKSTFLKLITQKIQPTSGTITINPNITIAYFGQVSTKELQLENTAHEFMCASFPKANPEQLKQHLLKTSLTNDAMNTRMKNLSFSQRSCVIFAKLTYVPPHLLILDEPTNFLDLETVESLISACKKFTGGLITVTHNRDFLKKTSKHFLSIVPGAFTEFNDMKSAEQATYSFISQLEAGKQVDAKSAIAENRGGGSMHSAELLAANNAKVQAQLLKAQQEHAEMKAEEERLAALALAKEQKKQAHEATLRTDWKAGETCWAPQKNGWVKVTVVRNVPAMGVTVEFEGGVKSLVEAKKLRGEMPAGSNEGGVASGAGGKGKSGGGGGRGGRGGSAGSQRGGSAGGRGGGRGGRGGR
ncbi:hypothetical protein HDV05_005490 [Chytridiales sp. JEL 0842]|nr:hypothetical protein HDV05_005490 [Chytridiales sp. JEL 0842]